MTRQRFLAGIRVLDLSQYIPGPLATRQLADLGADVIKIEPPQGDPMRRFMQAGDGAPSPVYQHLNRGKRILKLDLKSTKHQQCLEKLIIDADILLESYRPGARDILNKLNPRLIHCSLSGYGQTGPYRGRAGHDLNYAALAGIPHCNGNGEQPAMVFPPLVDHAGAMQASVAMLAALQGRHNSGEGTWLDISLFESGLSWQYLPLLVDGMEAGQSLLSGGAACYNLYQCADGKYFSLGAIETHFWENFCEVLERPDWVARQYESMPQAELLAEVTELIQRQPLAYWQQRLDQIDCCFEALLHADDIGQHPQVQARQSLSKSGPGYPGWINQATVTVDENLISIASAEDAIWK